MYASNYYDLKLNANYEMDKPSENPYVNLTVILNHYNLNTIVVKEINNKQLYWIWIYKIIWHFN